MAPEQIQGAAVSPATDVYSLGIVLFEMLTGRRPFQGDEIDVESRGSTISERIRFAHIILQPPDPRSLNTAIPAPLSQAILKSLSKEPNQRFPSTQAFYTAVCASLQMTPRQVPDRLPSSSLPPRSIEPPPVSPPNAELPSGTFAAGGTESSPPSGREKRSSIFGFKGVFLLAGFLVVILMVVFLGGGAVSSPNSPAPGSTGGLVVTETLGNLPRSTPPAPDQTNSAYISTAAAMTVIAQFTSEAPTTIPTDIPIPSATPSPIPTQAPSLSPSFGEIRFCSDPACSQGSKTQYPEGIEDVYFVFDYHNMEPGISYGRRWYVNGDLYLDYYCSWGPNWPSDGTFLKKVYDHYYGLAPGEWLLEIYLEGQLQSTASFTVKGVTRYEAFLENYTCNDNSPTLP
jgi:serine/threonine protein kinase